ncbi:MAG: glycoside hydrolase family 18 protein [Candidatus Saccharicenans sp.]|nr:glycoside hydrolase family 18 protein [Candidatus Saccharicenans sp.]
MRLKRSAMRPAIIKIKVNSATSRTLFFGLVWLLVLLFCSQMSSQQRGREFLQKEKTTVQQPKLAKAVMGYYPGWKKSEFNHSLIDFSGLTHLVHAFTRPDSEGNLVVDPGYLYPEMVAAAHKSSVKVILSIGGWGNCDGFPPTAASPEKRSRFIGQVVDFCQLNGYDGVDLDWEFVSNEQERQNFSDLVMELSTALKSMEPPRLLTMAAPSGPYYGKWINFEELHPYFDYISLMTYDYHGAWSDHSGHNSPLYTCQNDPCGSWDDSFSYAVIREIPLDKLLLGIPFFGRSFNTGKLYARSTQSQYYTYTDIQKLIASGWKYNWDFCSQVPFLLSPSKTTLLAFDDIRSVFRKCRYVLDKGLAGVIVWEITADRNNGRPELLQTIARTFRLPAQR